MNEKYKNKGCRIRKSEEMFLEEIVDKGMCRLKCTSPTAHTVAVRLRVYLNRQGCELKAFRMRVVGDEVYGWIGAKTLKDMVNARIIDYHKHNVEATIAEEETYQELATVVNKQYMISAPITRPVMRIPAYVRSEKLISLEEQLKKAEAQKLPAFVINSIKKQIKDLEGE